MISKMMSSYNLLPSLAIRKTHINPNRKSLATLGVFHIISYSKSIQIRDAGC
ncbi:hypothetical protein Hanom_Chr03g00249811 [Helianthus anomalus]